MYEKGKCCSPLNILTGLITLLLLVQTAFFILIRGQFSRSALIGYCAILLTGAAALIASLWFPRKWRIHFLLNVGAALLALILLELTLSLRQPETHAEAAKKAGVRFDARATLDVLADFRQQGMEVCTSIAPNLFQTSGGLQSTSGKVYPLAGLSRRLTVGNNELGYYGAYVSDEHGFNNPAGVFSNQVDLALIGDSFTHGKTVQQGEDIASYLRQSGHNVVNLGMSGSGPLEELAILTEYALPLRPRTVLWLYYEGNDLPDLARAAKSSWLTNYLQPGFSQKLLDRQPEVDALLTRYAKEQEQIKRSRPDWKTTVRRVMVDSACARVLTFSTVRSWLRGPAEQRLWHSQTEKMLPLFQQVLIAANQRVTERGSKLVMVYLPEYSRYLQRAVTNDSSRHRARVLDIARAAKLPVIDLHQSFEQQRDPLKLFPFRLQGHYTPRGYEFVAREIHQGLNREGLGSADLQVRQNSSTKTD